ncbi:hypothetical protein PISMIDRAFT_20442 [Pisolithus microcarpus 441]|uniref:Uncharacterized protein n=1 Tax=Pisolithus microcarpus 441 TaxID=765257 RepID=A0A0C9XZR3_9AGAM|nr:hypothetical protein PISMIDRAFT_20442 [Pisolithus microcarpus 441]
MASNDATTPPSIPIPTKGNQEMLAGLASVDNLPVPSDPVLRIDDGPATTVNRSVHTLIDLPTFNVLQTDPPSPSTSSSPTHAPPVLECDELDKHPRSPVPAAGNTLVSVPLGSPLMDLTGVLNTSPEARKKVDMQYTPQRPVRTALGQRLFAVESTA